MVKAGVTVDDFIEKLIPVLDPCDIIINGGNTHFPDAARRTAYVESKGLLNIGTGVSGGEEGTAACFTPTCFMLAALDGKGWEAPAIPQSCYGRKRARGLTIGA